MYTNESMGGALISMDYDDYFQHFTFYVDKAKYESNELFCSIGIGLTVTALSDTYQAYNFIPPEDRITDIQIVDNETGEVLNDCLLYTSLYFPHFYQDFSEKKVKKIKACLKHVPYATHRIAQYLCTHFL